MITKGIIKSIDYNSNTCVVRLPLFEGATSTEEIITTATFSIQPGVYNGYKEKDIVYVSFEDNSFDAAVITGKLFLGTKNENNDRGTINCDTLITKNATLPLSTKLSFDADENTKVDVKGGYKDYKTISDIIDNLQSQKTEIGNINIKLVDDGENLGARVTKVEEDNIKQDAAILMNAEAITAEVTRASEAEGELSGRIDIQAEEIEAKVSKTDDGSVSGFGWDLQNDHFTIFSEKGKQEEGLNRKPILKVDETGLTLQGKITIDGYSKSIESKYCKLNTYVTPSPIPSWWTNWDDEHWQKEVPSTVPGEYIWCLEKITYGDDSSELNGPYCKNGVPGDPGKSAFSLAIKNDFVTVPANNDGTVVLSDLTQVTEHILVINYNGTHPEFELTTDEDIPESGMYVLIDSENVTLCPIPEGASEYQIMYITAINNSKTITNGYINYTVFEDGNEVAVGKFEVAKMIAGASISVKGTVPTVADLPTTAKEGDAYVVETYVKPTTGETETGVLFVWDTEKWTYAGKFKGDKGNKGDPGEDGADGQDGKDGEDGVSIETKTEYAKSTSGELPAPTTGWTESLLTPSADKPYVWARFVTYINGSKQTPETPWLYQSLTGLVSILESDGIDIISKTGTSPNYTYHLKADTLTGAIGNNIQLGGTESGGVWSGGFVVRTKTSTDAAAIYSNSKTKYNDTNVGVYLGTDGIGLGNKNFYVNSNGSLYSASGTIGGFNILSDKLYSGTKSTISSQNAGVYLGNEGIAIGEGKINTSTGLSDTAGFKVNETSSGSFEAYIRDFNIPGIDDEGDVAVISFVSQYTKIRRLYGKNLTKYSTWYEHDAGIIDIIGDWKPWDLGNQTMSQVIDNHGSTISTHNTQIGNLQTNISTHTTQISTINNTLNTHNTKITNLQSTVTTHTTNISALQTNVATHTTNISDLFTEVRKRVQPSTLSNIQAPTTSGRLVTVAKIKVNE